MIEMSGPTSGKSGINNFYKIFPIKDGRNTGLRKLLGNKRIGGQNVFAAFPSTFSARFMT
jgi:hypothetical protein